MLFARTTHTNTALFWGLTVVTLLCIMPASLQDSLSQPAAVRSDALCQSSVKPLGRTSTTGTETRTSDDMYAGEHRASGLTSSTMGSAVQHRFANTDAAGLTIEGCSLTATDPGHEHAENCPAGQHSPDQNGAKRVIDGDAPPSPLIDYMALFSGTRLGPSGVEANASHFYLKFDRSFMGRPGVRSPAGVLPVGSDRHTDVCEVVFVTHSPHTQWLKATPSITEWRQSCSVIDAPLPSQNTSTLTKHTHPRSHHHGREPTELSDSGSTPFTTPSLERTYSSTSPLALPLLTAWGILSKNTDSMSTSIYDSATVCWWDVPKLDGLTAVEDARAFFDNPDNRWNTEFLFGKDGDGIVVPRPQLEIFPNTGMNDRAVKIFLNSSEYVPVEGDISKGERAIEHLSRLIEILTDKGYEATWAAAYARDRSPSTAYSITTSFGAKFDAQTRLRILTTAASTFGVAIATKDWDTKATPESVTGNIQLSSPSAVRLLQAAGEITVGEQVAVTSYKVRFTPIRFYIAPTTCTTVALPITTADRSFDLKAFEQTVEKFMEAVNKDATEQQTATNCRMSESSDFWLVDFSSIALANIFCSVPVHLGRFARPLYTLNSDPDNFLPHGIAQYNSYKLSDYSQRRERFRLSEQAAGRMVNETLSPMPGIEDLKPYTRKAVNKKRPAESNTSARFQQNIASNAAIIKAKVSAAERELRQFKGLPAQAAKVQKRLDDLRKELEQGTAPPTSGLTTPRATSPQHQQIIAQGQPSTSRAAEEVPLPFARGSSTSDLEPSDNEQDESGDITMAPAKRQRVDEQR